MIHFDSAEYPFDKLVLDAVRQALENLSRPAHLADLSRLHEVISPTDRPAIEQAIYALFGRAEFQSRYDRLCAHIVETRLAGAAAYQRTPSVRIHMPGARSVNYHTDEWYGHGHDVRNFWLPLVSVGATNSMYVIDPETSASLVEQMRTGRKSIAEMNEACHEKARPLAMRFGEIFAFDAHTLHGTVTNETDSTRVSFDFRMLVDGADRGLKDPSFFIRPNERGNGATAQRSTARAGVYTGKDRGLTGIISQKYQQLICLRYASDAMLVPLAVETELSGFEHHPTLWDMICGSYTGSFEALVFFSAQLLPIEPGERARVFREAANRGLTLHFVCEDVVVPPGGPLAAIEAAVA